jgi:hypothetical protein
VRGSTPKIAGSLNAALGRFGLRIRRVGSEVIDLRQETADPLEASYWAGPRHQAVIDVPLADCLILHANAFRCVAGHGNPFVATLERYDDVGCVLEARSPLRAFFDTWRPRHAADVLGIEPSRAHVSLRRSDPLAYVLPWDGMSLEEMMAERRAFIRRDHKKAGRSLNPAAGWKAWGPCSEALIEFEVRRLVDVFQSIRTLGFRRSDGPDGDIEAVVLRADGENRYLVSPGHHRAAALAALGYAEVPLRLSGIVVRREDVGAWPGVRKGLFTEEIALEVFDRVHAGRQPRALGAAASMLSDDRSTDVVMS